MSLLLPLRVYQIAEGMANSVDPDQMPNYVASDLGIHCLLKLICPKTKCNYGRQILFDLTGPPLLSDCIIPSLIALKDVMNCFVVCQVK